MHTDEYEISFGRELTLCRKRVKKLRGALDEREERHGMTTASLVEALEAGRLEDRKEYREWADEHRQLLHWSRMLVEYEEALKAVKEI